VIQVFLENLSEMNLDTTDRNLLHFLQQDCKQTNKELSSKLNLSVTAVYERIKKLEREGVINRYVAVLEKEKVGLGFVVFCQIKLAQHSKDYLTKFETEVKQLEEVLECFHVSGEYDYLLKVLVRDMPHFRSFMVTKLTTIQHIGSTQSSFTISEVKNTTAINFK
jgi:Lrp/AsnC family leucine-responsive transcriptional regulator